MTARLTPEPAGEVGKRLTDDQRRLVCRYVQARVAFSRGESQYGAKTGTELDALGAVQAGGFAEGFVAAMMILIPDDWYPLIERAARVARRFGEKA